MINKYKIIVMDFDGTILTDDKKITTKTISTINKLKDKGYFIVGATARTLCSCKYAIDIKLFDYLILNNGCNLYDVEKKKIIYENELSKLTYINIYNSIKRYSKKIELCDSSNYYTNNIKTDNKLKFIIYFNSIYKLKKICRMNIYIDEKQDFEKIYNYVSKKYVNIHFLKMKSSKNLNKWIVVMPKDTSKKNTLKILCNKLKIYFNQVVFIGDNFNDLDLIKSVGLGAAMVNSVDEIKKNTKFITEYDNNNNGVAIFLENKFLIGEEVGFEKIKQNLKK